MTDPQLHAELHALFCSHILTQSASIKGIGVHSGQDVELEIRPLALGSGIRFIRTDLDHATVPARWDTVVDTRNNTTIANQSGVTISTIEHLMAAFAARGVDDAEVLINGPELPIMDGSAKPFLGLVDQAQPQATDIPRKIIRVLKTIEVEGDGGRKAKLSPADTPSYNVHFSFRGRAQFPDEHMTFTPTHDSFDTLIAPARTFGLLDDAQKIKAMGLAKGASLENTVVFDTDQVLNPEGTHFKDECVRHKILDAIGDFHLAGGLILGQYEAIHTGHTLNNQLLRGLFSEPDAFRVE